MAVEPSDVAPIVGKDGDAGAGGGGSGSRGHRLAAHPAGRVLEAWGPDLAACVVESLAGVVDSFAQAPDAATSRVLPPSAPPGGAKDQLTSLVEDAIDACVVLSVVPVRFHLEPTEDGGLAGDMEVVPAGRARLAGPAPTTVSHRALVIGPVAAGGGWRCRLLLQR